MEVVPVQMRDQNHVGDLRELTRRFRALPPKRAEPSLEHWVGKDRVAPEPQQSGRVSDVEKAIHAVLLGAPS